MNRRSKLCCVASLCVSVIAIGCGSVSKPDAATDMRDRKSRGNFTTRKTKARQPNSFIVDKQFSIATPADGYAWHFDRTMKALDAKGMIYSCTKRGSTSAMTLVMQKRAASSDKARIATIKGHYNGMIVSLRNAGFTDFKAKRPSLVAPIPDLVLYSIECRKPTREVIHLRCASVFGRNTYAIQSIAGSLQEADDFSRVIATFTELSTSSVK